MRHRPAKPPRISLPKVAEGDDEHRAGIRALDCGEDSEPGVIRRATPDRAPDVPEPGPALGEQTQSV